MALGAHGRRTGRTTTERDAPITGGRTLRPVLRLLGPVLADRILDEAREVLATLGIAVTGARARRPLAEHGAVAAPDGRLRLGAAMIDAALASAPPAIALFDARGERTHDLSGDRVHFTPGSAAVHVLDAHSNVIRPATTADYVRYAKVVAGLRHFPAQSTAIVPSDVPAAIADAYRLYLSLVLGEKPVVTGAFGPDSVALMHDMLVIARGDAAALSERPLAIFSCCPTSPLEWSEVAAGNLLDCAKAGVPVEVVPMPLAGFIAPATLYGTLVQHAAEALSGVVLAQCARPGAPVLWGGSTAIFDPRQETAPMGALETMLLACGAAEVGKRLGLPTQAYIGLSDAKALDAQAGLETGMGLVLAALAGINSVSGPGMLEFENCQSVEKLVLDDEACAMALRLVRGVAPDGAPLVPVLRELLADGHLLISDHTLRHRDREVRQPGPVIDRARLSRWEEEGSELVDRGRDEADRLERAWTPPRVPRETVRELTGRMGAAARARGLDTLPFAP